MGKNIQTISELQSEMDFIIGDIQERHKTLIFKENEYDNLRGRVVDVVSKDLALL